MVRAQRQRVIFVMKGRGEGAVLARLHARPLGGRFKPCAVARVDNGVDAANHVGSRFGGFFLMVFVFVPVPAHAKLLYVGK